MSGVDWKGIAERGLERSSLARLARRLHCDQAVILAYHNVVPDDFPPVGDRSLHLPLSRFEAQLDSLVDTHEVVPLDHVKQPSSAGDRPRAVLTFDDAYRGALELGLPAVAERGLPATLFVAPGLLGTDGFWWDLLAEQGPDPLDPKLRRHALTALEGRQESVLKWARGCGLEPASLPQLARPATEEAVLEVAARSGVTIGSHSWSHPSLPTQGSEALREELARANDWLVSAAAGDVPRWLAYPYGNHDRDARRAAEAAGCAGAVTGDSGWVRPPVADCFAVPRINVPAGLSESGFRLRAAGVPLP